MSNISTVAAVLAKDLAALGARRCFGLLGTANFKISHGLVEAGVELISARHEGNAASMADAYAKATGELTLVSVHSGPGLTNAITGIGEAAKSRTPLLVLAGDVPTGNVNQGQVNVPKINEAMAAAELIKDKEARAKAWGKIDEELVENAVAIPYDWEKSPRLAASNVHGVAMLWNEGSWDYSFTSLK